MSPYDSTDAGSPEPVPEQFHIEFTERAAKLAAAGDTSGEDTGLPDLLGDLSLVPGIEDIALTTNGVLLRQHAAALRAAGLRRVTISLDSLDPDTFLPAQVWQQAARCGCLEVSGERAHPAAGARASLHPDRDERPRRKRDLCELPRGRLRRDDRAARDPRRP